MDWLSVVQGKSNGQFFQFLQVYARSQCYCKKNFTQANSNTYMQPIALCKELIKKMLIQHLNTSKVQMLGRLLAGGEGQNLINAKFEPYN